eukprot:s138_g7.t1
MASWHDSAKGSKGTDQVGAERKQGKEWMAKSVAGLRAEQERTFQEHLTRIFQDLSIDRSSSAEFGIELGMRQSNKKPIRKLG